MATKTDAQTLLDEVNGRLTAVWVKYPAIRPFIWSFQKHVVFALNNTDKADLPRLFRKGREWLHKMAWKHPLFRPDFMAIVERIQKFEQR